MSELQPGMLALVVGCRKNPSNIGKVVELLRFMKPGEDDDGRKFLGPAPAWRIKGENLVFLNGAGETSFASTSYAESRHLLPIKPEQDPLEITEKDVLHA